MVYNCHVRGVFALVCIFTKPPLLSLNAKLHMYEDVRYYLNALLILSWKVCTKLTYNIENRDFILGVFRYISMHKDMPQ